MIKWELLAIRCELFDVVCVALRFEVLRLEVEWMFLLLFYVVSSAHGSRPDCFQILFGCRTDGGASQ
jgi:hypothetical protein